MYPEMPHLANVSNLCQNRRTNWHRCINLVTPPAARSEMFWTQASKASPPVRCQQSRGRSTREINAIATMRLSLTVTDVSRLIGDPRRKDTMITVDTSS